MKRASFLLLLVLSLFGSPTFAADPVTAVKPWPHEYTVDKTSLVLHQPQLDSWQGDELKGRLVVAVKAGTVVGADGKSQDKINYGVAWFSARTHVDKEKRLVTLSNVSWEKVTFPTDGGNESRYLNLLKLTLPDQPLTISQDQLESDLAIQNAAPANNVSVNNAPPAIIFAFQPTLLVLVDGQPAWQKTAQRDVQRALNTRSLLLKDKDTFYVRFADAWFTADGLNGDWKEKASVPAEITNALQEALKKGHPDVGEASGKKVTKPQVITVATAPTELIQLAGDPQFMPIAGTGLSYIANTPSDVFINSAEDNAWYVLVSGRWFRAASTNGPWTYVAGDKLPADFAKIPGDSPKSAVLASIPGTPEAREALIANAVPQTATITRSKAKLSVHYDGGRAQFKSITSTPLQYAWNADLPVIKVDAKSYFAVKNGVWFSATSPTGPWAVADNVPAIIYTIPADSPLHYVTYVHVYNSTPETVFVGYTPGYYGTVVSNNVVVYGTGYPCNAWVGSVWYSCPVTYGYGSSFAWDPAIGWSFGFISGWIWGSDWHSPGWGPWDHYYPPYPGYWGGGVSVYNVYNHWGNTVAQGVRADWGNGWTGRYGSSVRGSFYNQATGTHGWGYANKVGNEYNDLKGGSAGGVRFNPQTGRAVSGRAVGVHNDDNGNAIGGDVHNSINARTGRATHSQGIAAGTDQGAGKAGSFTSVGPGGAVHGAGYVHYDKETGQVTHGGFVNGPDHVYASHDGGIYQFNNGSWQKMDNSGKFVSSRPPTEVNADRQARERGSERVQSQQSTALSQTRHARPVTRSVNPPQREIRQPSQANREQWQEQHPQAQINRQQRQVEHQRIERPAVQPHQFDRSGYVPRFSGRMGGRR